MKPCRTFWQDLMVTEPVDSKMDFIYTEEVGIVQEQTYGEEDLSAIRDWKMREKMTKQKKKTTDEKEKEKGRTTETKNVKETEHSESCELVKEMTLEAGVNVHANPAEGGMAAVTGPAGLGDSVPGPGGASAGASAKGETRDTERDEKSEKNTKTDTKRHKDKLFSKTTKSQALMQHFKSTHGAASSLESSQFVQTTTAFEKVERVDVRVENIPPGKKLILQQMMFDCDGNVVKMPFIQMIDEKGRELNVTKKSVGGQISKVLKPNWLNQTKAMDANGIRLTGTISNISIVVNPMAEKLWNMFKIAQKDEEEEGNSAKKASTRNKKKQDQDGIVEHTLDEYFEYL